MVGRFIRKRNMIRLIFRWILVSLVIGAVVRYGHAVDFSRLTSSMFPSSAAAGAPMAGSSVEVGFSPGNAEELVVREIDRAHRSILVAAYSFTSKAIAQALVRAARRGVDVRVVMDKSQKSERYTSATFLANMRIPVRIDSRYAIMHNKFMVIDGETVQTGSFNYTTAAARRNAENVLVLRDNPQVASTYRREWDRLWNESEPLAPRY